MLTRPPGDHVFFILIAGRSLHGLVYSGVGADPPPSDFSFSLVLFEFATYIAHDMIQPGMLLVTREFNVGPGWVSASLTAYLIGGIVLQWLLGPLSDKVGRRPVMLAGVAFFMVICFAMPAVQNIEQFILMRFLQGISLCFIGAVGYAAIQEAFDEALSVKMMALMANIALLAPLAGPLAGAAFLAVSDWCTMFWLFGSITAVALVGLWFTMPETSGDKNASISLKSLGKGYARLLADRQVMRGSLAIGLATIPCLAWVALSPVILIHDAGLNKMNYALLQLPVFVAMIAGNLTLVRIARRFPLEQPLRIAAWPVLGGLLLSGSLHIVQPAKLSVAHCRTEPVWFWHRAGQCQSLPADPVFQRGGQRQRCSDVRDGQYHRLCPRY